MPYPERHLATAITGALLGGLIGAGFGLSIDLFVLVDPPFFTGDTVLIGAVGCGGLGYVLGDRFIEWLKENWWWFW